MEGQMNITDFCESERDGKGKYRRIPDKIWKQQCQVCIFRQGDENFLVDRQHGTACEIDATRFENIFWKDEQGKFHEMTPEEYYEDHMCSDWTPTKALREEKHCCDTCHYWNPFQYERDEDGNRIYSENDYCTHREGPLNKSRVWDIRIQGPSDDWKHIDDTCERWKKGV